jgi:hypothetical protein
MKRKILNPFPVTGYIGSDYFCDRKDEADQLIKNFSNGNSTTLIALRRIGKTGLIHHVFSRLPKGWGGIYVDILETENLNQFLNVLATAIIRAFPEKSSVGKQFWSLIKKLRPVIGFDALSGSPQISFDAKPIEVEQNIDTLLHTLEQQDFKIVFAIDEFQQILQYPEKNTDAWLRTRIQKMQNVFFIFSGSEQHLMSELFFSPNRPFYHSTSALHLEKIDSEVYASFIHSMFKKFNKTINIEIAHQILQWTDNHTFYVQQLCNRVFASTSNEVTSELWKNEAKKLMEEQEQSFFTIRNMLTTPQWNLLKAIAIDSCVYHPTSGDFLMKHKLGTSATVLRSLKTLLNYELIIRIFDKEGKTYYCVYDVTLKRWVETKQ